MEADSALLFPLIRDRVQMTIEPLVSLIKEANTGMELDARTLKICVCIAEKNGLPIASYEIGPPRDDKKTFFHLERNQRIAHLLAGRSKSVSSYQIDPQEEGAIRIVDNKIVAVSGFPEDGLWNETMAVIAVRKVSPYNLPTWRLNEIICASRNRWVHYLLPLLGD